MLNLSWNYPLFEASSWGLPRIGKADPRGHPIPLRNATSDFVMVLASSFPRPPSLRSVFRVQKCIGSLIWFVTGTCNCSPITIGLIRSSQFESCLPFDSHYNAILNTLELRKLQKNSSVHLCERSNRYFIILLEITKIKSTVKLAYSFNKFVCVCFSS